MDASSWYRRPSLYRNMEAFVDDIEVTTGEDELVLVGL